MSLFIAPGFGSCTACSSCTSSLEHATGHLPSMPSHNNHTAQWHSTTPAMILWRIPPITLNCNTLMRRKLLFKNIIKYISRPRAFIRIRRDSFTLGLSSQIMVDFCCDAFPFTKLERKPTHINSLPALSTHPTHVVGQSRKKLSSALLWYSHVHLGWVPPSAGWHQHNDVGQEKGPRWVTCYQLATGQVSELDDPCRNLPTKKDPHLQLTSVLGDWKAI